MAGRHRFSRKRHPYRFLVPGLALLVLTMCSAPVHDAPPPSAPNTASQTNDPAPIARYSFTDPYHHNPDDTGVRVRKGAGHYIAINRLMAQLNAITQALYEIQHPKAPPPQLHSYHLIYNKVAHAAQGKPAEIEITLVGDDFKGQDTKKISPDTEYKTVMAYDMLDIHLSSPNKNLKIIAENIETKDLHTLKQNGTVQWKWKVQVLEPDDYQINILTKPVSSKKDMHQSYQNIDTITVEAGMLDTLLFYLKKYLWYLLGLVVLILAALFIRKSTR